MENDIILNDLSDKLKEECGVFGVYDNDGHNVAALTYYGLYSLQHRGQESCGIAVNRDGEIISHKGMGLVPEVFNEKIISRLDGKMAIGHNRYSTTGASMIENAQPMVIKYKIGNMALAHNGNLINEKEIRMRKENERAIFQTSIDSEVIANLISRYRILSEKIEETLIKVIKGIKGSYALVLLTPKRLFGIRDPWGIRPLCIGKLDNSYILASETCALDSVGAKFIRDVEPGEIVAIGEKGIESIKTQNEKPSSLCIFEYIYFARPDSVIDGSSVHQARLEAGKRLAIEYPVEADLVIGVPDSGLTAALGYSRHSGIPFGEGLIKNRYVGRTFIQPDQRQRERGVQIKLNPLKYAIEGKRIIMIDDSIVRGTTSRRIVQMLKDGGAKEVHMRVAAPPIMHPCFFGIDTGTREQLVAARKTVEEIRQMVGADSLGFLSVEGLTKTPIDSKCGFCTACFTGKYPMEVPYEADKYTMDKC